MLAPPHQQKGNYWGRRLRYLFTNQRFWQCLSKRFPPIFIKYQSDSDYFVLKLLYSYFAQCLISLNMICYKLIKCAGLDLYCYNLLPCSLSYFSMLVSSDKHKTQRKLRRQSLVLLIFGHKMKSWENLTMVPVSKITGHVECVTRSV